MQACSRAALHPCQQLQLLCCRTACTFMGFIGKGGPWPYAMSVIDDGLWVSMQWCAAVAMPPISRAHCMLELHDGGFGGLLVWRGVPFLVDAAASGSATIKWAGAMPAQFLSLLNLSGLGRSCGS